MNLDEASTLKRFEKLVSPKYGVFRDVGFMKGLAGTPPAFVAAVTYHRKPSQPAEVIGTGASFHRTSALISALGEAAERYSAYDHGQCAILKARSFTQMRADGHLTISFEDTIYYSPAQFAWPDFGIDMPNLDTKLDWVEGVRLSDRAPIFVPAWMAFFDYQNRPDSTTNGLGCGSSPEQAALSGLLEVVERDAFMFAWWTQTSFPMLDLAGSKSKEITKLRKLLGAWADRYRLIHVEMEHGIPAFFCTYRGTGASGDAASITCGSAGLHAPKAVVKAIAENLHCHTYAASQLERLKLRVFDENFDRSVKCFMDSFGFYLSESNAPRVDFLIDPTKQKPLDAISDLSTGDFKADLQRAVGLLAATGAQPISVDLTTRDVAACGLSVSRVIIPGYLHLNGAHRFRTLGLKRLYEIKQKLGMAERRLRLEDLNSMPHPYP